MGDCSTPQPKRPGGRPANPSADREPEEAKPLLEQAASRAQARQVRLEGRDSIVRFMRRTATGSPEWGREHVRWHATEEEADSQISIEERIPAHGTSLPDISTDTDSHTEGHILTGLGYYKIFQSAMRPSIFGRPSDDYPSSSNTRFAWKLLSSPSRAKLVV
ncbi:hypothetical protein NDU88_001447 [Pleurodeles waltl]|uniref:Uncharacterized protein n=1 Tax=Pleurodeles waltl TaxID=8319 RepID=A0AAV7LCM0_PLEWA|nr:hypothetical protein NDU88_001447 [Pleurodeles waltl]